MPKLKRRGLSASVLIPSRMVNAKVALLSLIIFSSLLCATSIDLSSAEKGCVKVYIISLTGVGGSWVGNPSRVAQGVTLALNGSESYSIPLVHPKYGKVPPFYKIDYQVVSDWDTYRCVVASADSQEVIVVNTHGQILPIPKPEWFTKEQWVDRIADGLLNRRLTWVHIGGYPFYRVWYEGATASQEWGTVGFQQLMSHINMPSIDCLYPGSPSDTVDVNDAARYMLKPSWGGLYNTGWVQVGKPLKAADIKDYLVLPIFGGGSYYTGAIIGFAKPGQRFSATTHYGFGAYVHIGAGATFDENRNPTEMDYWLGYVGGAAAGWAEMESYKGSGMNSGSLYAYPYAESAIFCRPTISSYNSYSDAWWIRVSFPVYGSLRVKKETPTRIDYVSVDMNDLPSDCTIMMDPSLSREGKNSGLRIQGLDTGNDGKRIAEILLFILALPCVPAPISYPATALGGIMLFSDWIGLSPSGTGVGTPASSVDFDYVPRIMENETRDGYLYHEFESIITVELKVPNTGRNQWRIVTFDWGIGIHTFDTISPIPYADGEITIALYNNYSPTGFEATVFFDDFEDGMEGWNTADYDSLAGYDYWGATNKFSFGNSAWSSYVGDNSIYGMPNTEAAKFDKNMNACLTYSTELRSYQTATISYELEHYLKSGDYLAVEYFADSYWHELVRHTESYGFHRGESFPIPNDAEQIRFCLMSNGDNDVAFGALIDDVEIKGILPNDAINQNIDAGDNFTEATPIPVGSEFSIYIGYINDEDWYKFSAAKDYDIWIEMRYPLGCDYVMDLRDPEDICKVSGQRGLLVYPVSKFDKTGSWRVRIYSLRGFGQYRMDIRVFYHSTGGGGGGCPYVSTWNGMRYVLDNNLLPASESSVGTIEDHYVLQQPLVPDANGEYAMLISEFEKEHSFFDSIQLLAVDHQSGTKVAVSPYGEILTYTNPHLPKSAIDNENHNVKNLLSSADGNYYQGYDGSYIVLNFGDLSLDGEAKLVLRADAYKKSIYIQVQDSKDNWATVAVIIPRINWATEIVNLSGCLPDYKGDIKVRLYFTASHKVDYVGLDTGSPVTIQVQEAQLTSAIHSKAGEISTLLLHSDQICAELIPGEQINLVFTLEARTMASRTYILVVEGRYYTIEA